MVQAFGGLLLELQLHPKDLLGGIKFETNFQNSVSRDLLCPKTHTTILSFGRQPWRLWKVVPNTNPLKMFSHFRFLEGNTPQGGEGVHGEGLQLRPQGRHLTLQPVRSRGGGATRDFCKLKQKYFFLWKSFYRCTNPYFSKIQLIKINSKRYKLNFWIKPN